jgi:hypothetical protein
VDAILLERNACLWDHVGNLANSLEACFDQPLERFTFVLYDKTSELESVNEARRELFCQNNKTMEYIPPTQDSLLQHFSGLPGWNLDNM